ncbi:cation diffusion facilitator family transporter [Geomicrobium sp. JCM 19039]|uniref:cation diffusion facilitator family transporter n=1 Tax=Geomicrobium sp. JCM 19039 TaxID=1460636 RepID=UPI00045F1F95|nr:cation diffusion facilitator family transporter [Geomicrobium sp. JCM 19039]GAK11317.1 cobalt-zinc-cadmium resistance protein [Geomicrobium sp. JCM 19039]
MQNGNSERFKKINFAAWLGIGINIVLAALKFFVGWFANSRALIADALHSAADVVTSFAVLIGVRAAELPPDEDHPYGHGKAESITAIIVSVLLFVIGLDIAISTLGDIGSENPVPGIAALYVIIFSIIVKEALFRYKLHLGKKYNSEAIITDAWHHRSDAYSSIAAMVGVGASLLGAQFGLSWLMYGDMIAGVFVAALVMVMAYKLGRDAIHNSLDHVLHEEDTVDMIERVNGVEGLIKIDEFHAREHGHYVIVDIKIVVNPDISVREGHDIAKRVKNTLMEEDRVRDVLVHVNPLDVDERETKRRSDLT